MQPNAPEASSDDQLIALWLHGRSRHTQRAYLADVDRFRGRAGKTLSSVTLADLQEFAASLEDLAPATRYRALSAVKSLLAFGHRIGYLPGVMVGKAIFSTDRGMRQTGAYRRCASSAKMIAVRLCTSNTGRTELDCKQSDVVS